MTSSFLVDAFCQKSDQLLQRQVFLYKKQAEWSTLYKLYAQVLRGTQGTQVG